MEYTPPGKDEYRVLYLYENISSWQVVPWFQRFIFIIFMGRGKINLWLKEAIDSSRSANQFELGSDPDSVF